MFRKLVSLVGISKRFSDRSAQEMDFDRCSPVPPTSVRLYHRHDAGKSHQSTSWKTSTDFPQKACLVVTTSKRNELQIWDGPETTGRGSSDGAVSPTIPPGLDPGSRQAVSFDLKSIKSCVFKERVWIEITSSSGQCRAIEFDKDNPNFVDFYERLISILKLSGVKLTSTKATIDRAKWFPSLPATHSRQLPPVPTDSPDPNQLPTAEELEKYDYVPLLSVARGLRESTEADWPRDRAPSPSPSTIQRNHRQTPEGESRRSTADYIDTLPIPYSTNSRVANNRGSPKADPESNDHYLQSNDRYLPLIDQDEPRYLNDHLRDRNTPPVAQSRQKVTSEPQGTSGPEWSCRKCTYWNSSAAFSCKMCDTPKWSDTDRCSNEGKVRRKDTSSCEDCRSGPVGKSKSLDSRESRKTDHKVAPSNKDRLATSGSGQRFEECAECVRSGSMDRIECPVCRMDATYKANSLDGYDQRNPEREENCMKRIFNLTVTERDKPSGRNVQRDARAKGPSAVTLPPSSVSPAAVNVDRWRCKMCTCINPANVFYCTTCDVVRSDAWQCQVCDAVINTDVVRCQRCDVWRCRLCTFQNDAGANRSRVCQQCQQPQ